jgi:hypothetical protein
VREFVEQFSFCFVQQPTNNALHSPISVGEAYAAMHQHFVLKSSYRKASTSSASLCYEYTKSNAPALCPSSESAAELGLLSRVEQQCNRHAMPLSYSLLSGVEQQFAIGTQCHLVLQVVYHSLGCRLYL